MPQTVVFFIFFCRPINGPKDPKMWPVRGFALHPKGALPTNMGFHHSIFTLRLLTVPFLEAPPAGPPKINVDVESPFAPHLNLLSEGDFFP